MPEFTIPMHSLDPEAASAIQRLQQELSAAPNSMQLWQNYAKLLHAHGFDQQAKLSYEYANFIQPTTETTYLLSLTLAELGDYEGAIHLCSGIGGYQPAIWQLGYWHLDLGEYEKAIACFDNAIAQNASAAAAIIGKSRVYIAQNRFEEAVEILRDVQNRGGSHPYVTFLLGTALQRMGKHDIATPLLNAPVPVPLQWDDPWFLNMQDLKRGFAASFNRATEKLDNGNIDGALADLKALHQKYPENVTVTNNLGAVYLELNRPQDAIKIIAKGLTHAPNHAPSHLSLSLALIRLDALEEAEESALKAIEFQPSFGMAYVTAGRIALMNRDLPLAREHLEKAMAIGTNDPVNRQMLAMIYLDLNMNVDALNQFQLVLQADPMQTMSIGGKAVALLRLGMKEEAMEVLRNADIEFPNDPNIRRAMNTVLQEGRMQ